MPSTGAPRRIPRPLRTVMTRKTISAARRFPIKNQSVAAKWIPLVISSTSTSHGANEIVSSMTRSSAAISENSGMASNMAR